MSTHPGEIVMGPVKDPSSNLELLTLLSMLTPLTTEEAHQRRTRFDVGPPVELDADDYSYFTCRHWDESTRLCTIYDTRPWMCRTYPGDFYGLQRKCQHCTCIQGEACWPMPLFTRHCLGVIEMERNKRKTARSAH